MIEVDESELHPFDMSGEATRYMVVFWSDATEPGHEQEGIAWAECQAIVRSTENDVDEVHAWATSEMANPELGNVRFFQLFVIVEHTEGERPWRMRLSGPDDPTMGEWVHDDSDDSDASEHKVAGVSKPVQMVYACFRKERLAHRFEFVELVDTEDEVEAFERRVRGISWEPYVVGLG